MVMNERAKTEYEHAVGFRDLAAGHVDRGEINEAIVCNGLASVTIEIAKFAAENHALVAGIDEDDFAKMQQQPNPGKPQGVWGGPPTT